MYKLGDFVNQVSMSIANNTNAATTGSTAGSSVDCLALENQMLAIRTVNEGLTGNTPLIATKMQESTDGSTWTDVQRYSVGSATTGATAQFSSTAATTNAVGTLSFNRTARYVRPYHTITGTGTLAIPVTVAIGGQKKVL